MRMNPLAPGVFLSSSVLILGQDDFNDGSEKDGKGQPHHPVKVSHGCFLFQSGPAGPVPVVGCCARSVERVRVLLDVFAVELAAHDLVGPAGVQEHQREEDQRDEQHDFKRQLRARAVPEGESGVGHRRGRHDEREHREQRRQDDAEQRGGREHEGEAGLVRTDHDGAAERADHAESGHEPEHGHGGEVGEPGAGLNLDGLGERVGRAGGIKTGDGDVAVDAGPDPEAADHEEHGGDDACDEGDVAGTGLHVVSVLSVCPLHPASPITAAVVKINAIFLFIFKVLRLFLKKLYSL